MSQQNRQQNPVAANTPIDKERLAQAQQEFEKLNPQERSAVLKELEKELQAETSQEAAPLLEFIMRNIKKIITILVVIIALIALTNFLQWKNEEELKAAKAELNSISEMKDMYVKLDALEAFAVRAPKDLQIAIVVEEISAALAVEEYEFAIAKMKLLIAAEQGSALAVSMTLALSDVLISTEKYDEAIIALETFLPLASDDVKNTMVEEIATIAELSGNTDRAIAAYNELLAIPELAQAHPYYKERLKALSK